MLLKMKNGLPLVKIKNLTLRNQEGKINPFRIQFIILRNKVDFLSTDWNKNGVLSKSMTSFIYGYEILNKKSDSNR